MKLMKKAALLCSLALFCGGMLSAQSVDEVINKHIKARGGLKKWDKIKTMKVSGTFTGFSVPQPFKIVKAEGGAYLLDTHLGKKKIDVGFKDGKGWKIDLWFGSNAAALMSKAQHDTWIQQTDMATPFFNYKKNGHQVKLLGKESVDGVECYKIELIRKNGGKEIWSINAKTFLEFSSDTPGCDFGRGMRQVTFYDDFRKVKGVKVPFAVESEFSIRHRVFEVDKVEFNTPVDKKIFDRPVTPEMKKLAFMKGEWDVVIEVMGRDGKFRPFDKLKTKINSDLNGELLEEKVFRTKGGAPHWVYMRFYYDRAAKSYAMSEFNSTRSSTEIMHGKLEGKKIVFSKEPEKDAKRKSRLVMNITDDKNFAFVMEMAPANSDKWRTRARLVYKKK